MKKLIVAALMFFSGTAAAETPTSFILQRHERLSHNDIDDVVDYDSMVRRSLGVHWLTLIDSQKKEFRDTLRGLIKKNIMTRIGDTKRGQIVWHEEEPPRQDDSVMVKTRLSVDDGKDLLEVWYQVTPHGKEFRIVDVIVEGSSTVESYRKQFHRIIAKEGVESLLRRMKTKLTDGASH